MSGKKKYTGPLFVTLYYWEMDCLAYRHLSVYGRALLLEFRRLYNTHNNGKISMAVRQAAKLLNCCKDTAVKALEELEDKGWIRLTSKGSFSQKTEKTASEWRITNHPIGLGVDTPATKEYAIWRPDEIQNTVLLNRTTGPTKPDRKQKHGPTKPDRTPLNGPTRPDRGTPKTHPYGPTRPDTSISTIGEDVSARRGVAQSGERR